MARKNYGNTLEGRFIEMMCKKTGKAYFARLWVDRFAKYHFGK